MRGTPRGLLAQALGNPRLVVHFEKMGERVSEVEALSKAAVEATDNIDAATVITLSANKAFTNERVLQLGRGLEWNIETSDITLSVSYSIPSVSGDAPVIFTVSGETNVALPLNGLLATVSGKENLSNKTMVKPSLSGIVNALNDSAAAAAGVLVGGIYHNSGALMIRRS